MSKESFARGFCKVAEAAGVDPVALAKYAQSIVFGGGPTLGGSDIRQAMNAGRNGFKKIKDIIGMDQSTQRMVFEPLGKGVRTAYDDLPWYKKVLVGLSPDVTNRLRRTPSKTKPANGSALSRTTVPASNN